VIRRAASLGAAALIVSVIPPPDGLAGPSSPSSPSAASSTSALVQLTLDASTSLVRDPVWPGYAVLAQPVLLHDPHAGRSWLVAHPAPPPDFALVQAGPPSVFMKDGAIPELQSEYYTDVPIGGRPVFALVEASGADPIRAIGVLVHERFHVHQKAHFARERYDERYPVRDAENLALATLEQRALAEALRPTAGVGTPRAAAMFVAIRTLRNRRLGDGLRHVEDGLERIEGTADYVEQRTLARLTSAEPAGSTWGEEDVRHRLDLPLDQDRLTRSRYYETGSAQAFLLDRAGPSDWKQRLESGTSLRELTAGAFPIPPGEVEALVEAAKSALLGYGRLVAECRDQLRRAAAEQDAAIHAFASTPGYEVRISQPPADTYSANFTAVGPHYDLPDGATLYPRMALLDIRRGDFRLEVRDRPMIDQGIAYKFHVSRKALLLLDDTALPLKPVERPFHSLALADAGVQLSATVSGSLRIQGAVLTVEWNAVAP